MNILSRYLLLFIFNLLIILSPKSKCYGKGEVPIINTYHNVTALDVIDYNKELIYIKYCNCGSYGWIAAKKDNVKAGDIIEFAENNIIYPNDRHYSRELNLLFRNVYETPEIINHGDKSIALNDIDKCFKFTLPYYDIPEGTDIVYPDVPAKLDVSDFVNVLLGQVSSNEIGGIKSNYDASVLGKIFDIDFSIYPDSNGNPYKISSLGYPLGKYNDDADVTVEYEYDKPQLLLSGDKSQFNLMRENLDVSNPVIVNVKYNISLQSLRTHKHKDEIFEAIVSKLKFGESKDVDRIYYVAPGVNGSPDDLTYTDDATKTTWDITTDKYENVFDRRTSIHIDFKYGIPNAVKTTSLQKEASLSSYKAILDVKVIDKKPITETDYADLSVYKNNKLIYYKKISMENYSKIVDLQMIKTQKDGNPLIVINNNTIGGSRSFMCTHIIEIDDNINTYNNYHIACNDGFDIKEIDGDGTSKFIWNITSGVGPDAVGARKIMDFQNGKFTDVTKRYNKYINMVANSIIDNTNNNLVSTDLADYMAHKYVLGNKSEAWKMFNSRYKGKDKKTTKKELSKKLDEFMKIYNGFKVEYELTKTTY